jgi:hypothetical protein
MLIIRVLQNKKPSYITIRQRSKQEKQILKIFSNYGPKKQFDLF